MTPHDATAAVPPPVRGSPELETLPTLRRPPAPVRRLQPAPTALPALAPAPPATGRSSGPIAACGSCLLVATGPKGDLLAVDPARPRAPRRVVGRHGSRVTALVVDEGLVVSAGCDGLLVGRATSGTDDLAAVVGWHPAGVTTALRASDGRLVTAGHDGRVLAWCGGRSELLATHSGGVESVAVLASGALVTAGRDGRVLHRPPGGGVMELRRRRCPREITLAMTPIGARALLTAGGQRGAVRLWDDLEAGDCPEQLGVHGGWVLALVTLDADRVVAIGGPHLTVWDLRSGDSERIPLDDGLHATAAVVLPTGDLAVSDVDGAVQVVPA